MTNFSRLGRLTLLAVLAASACLAQRNTLSATTVTAAISDSVTRFAVGSVTGMTVASANAGTAGTALYVNDTPGGPGEAMIVTSIDATNLVVGVRRGQTGTIAVAHLAGAFVLYGQQNWFRTTADPRGSCTAANTEVTPVVNVITGAQSLCSTVLNAWVPGFNNPRSPGVTTIVASTAGTVTPSGNLFHVSGTAAVTGFVLPLGFVGGSFCIIPDAAFTTTTAGNLAKATTLLTPKVVCSRTTSCRQGASSGVLAGLGSAGVS